MAMSEGPTFHDLPRATSHQPLDYDYTIATPRLASLVSGRTPPSYSNPRVVPHEPEDSDYTKANPRLSNLVSTSTRTPASYSPRVRSNFSAPAEYATDQLPSASPAPAPADRASGDANVLEELPFSGLLTFRSSELTAEERGVVDWPAPPPLSHRSIPERKQARSEEDDDEDESVPHTTARSTAHLSEEEEKAHAALWADKDRKATNVFLAADEQRTLLEEGLQRDTAQLARMREHLADLRDQAEAGGVLHWLPWDKYKLQAMLQVGDARKEAAQLRVESNEEELEALREKTEQVRVDAEHTVQRSAEVEELLEEAREEIKNTRVLVLHEQARLSSQTKDYNLERDLNHQRIGLGSSMVERATLLEQERDAMQVTLDNLREANSSQMAECDSLGQQLNRLTTHRIQMEQEGVTIAYGKMKFHS